MKWILNLLGRAQRDRELSDEIRAHIEEMADDLVESGLSQAEAWRRAVREFGNATLVQENSREVWHWVVLESSLRDIRYGLRQMRRAPGFAAVATLTLALGIGANTAIFSVMDAVMLRSLPVPDPQQLVFLNSTVQLGSQSGDGDTSLSEYVFEQLRTQREVFSDLVAFAPLSFQKVSVRYGKEPEEAQANMVSGNFFSGLGVKPALGRILTLEDETSHAQLAVLSYGYWSRRFGRDPSILGQALYVKGVPFTIVGIAAPDFAGVENKKASDIWIPLQDRPDLKPWDASPLGDLSLYRPYPSWWCLKTIGRLAPGISEKQALARLTPVFEQAALAGVKDGDNVPDEQPRLYFTSARGIDGLRNEYEEPLTVLMLMVGVVLVIACANITMLLIARNAARQREFSIRLALGGSRSRLFRQLLAESLLLVALGGAVGWLFAVWATRAMAAWARLDVSVTPDRRVLLFALGVSLLTGCAFGLAPLRSVLRVPAGLALRTSGASAYQGWRKTRSGPAVIALQISMCLVLLVGAGLLLRTLWNLERVNLGIRTAGLLVFGVNPAQSVHSDAESVRFYERLLDEMRALPGVESATLMRNRIGSGWSSNSRVLVDGADPNGSPAQMRWNTVGPDYFHVMGTPLLFGRDIAEADSSATPRVVVVNQTFATRYLRGVSPLGHRIRHIGTKPDYEIVGVAADSKYIGIGENDTPVAYFPYTQVIGISSMNLELRTPGDPSSLLPSVHRAMASLAPDIALLQPMTQQEQFDNSVTVERLLARLSIFFGSLAALLVATGLYGTLTYSVSRRTAEVGVRMALGAQRRQILWMVLRGSLAISLAGVLLGLPLAVAGARFLKAMLFGVEPGDPWIFAAAVTGIIVVAVLSSLLPARRAASVDPIVALRFE